MNYQVKNLTDVLTYSLEGMYDTEKQIQKTFPEIIELLPSGPLKKALSQYVDRSKDQRLKLKRAFSYVSGIRFNRKNRVTDRMMKGAVKVMEEVKRTALRDVMLLTRLVSIAHFKACEYQSAKEIALYLELEPVADLLDEVLGWEKSMRQALEKIRSSKLNATQRAAAQGNS